MAGEALLPLALVVLLLLPPLARSFAPIPAGDSASWFGLRVSKGAWSRVFLPETIFTLLSLLVASAVSVAASLFGSPYPITTSLCLAACVGALLRLVLARGSPGGSRAPSHCPLTGSPYTTVTPIVTRAAALRGPTDTFSSAFAALTAAPMRTLPSPWRVQPVVLVIAHPDDESMFFSPLLASLFASNETQFIAHASPEADTRSAAGQVTVSRLIYEPHVLCLSTGGADGLGKLRPAELVKAAALLGVSPDHTRVIDDPALPDSMTSHWDPAVVAAHIHEYIADLPVSPPPSSSDPSRLPVCLVTFDGAGASGHANHCAVARGAALVGSQSYSGDVYAGGSESTSPGVDDEAAAAGSSSSSMSLSNSDHNEDGDSEEGNGDSVSPLPPSKASQKSPMRRTSRSRSTSSARVASSSLPRISVNEANAGIRVWHLQTMPLLLRYLGPISPLLCLLPLPLPLHLPQPNPQSPVAAALAGAKAAWGALLRAFSQSQKVEFPSAVVLTHPSAPAVAQAAMRRHRSQWVWYRRLYVLFSWHAHVTVLTRAADD